MLTKLASLASTVPWLIEEPWLREVLIIANREGRGVEAVEAELGRPLKNTQQVTVRDGVAIVPVNGPIFRHANLFTFISGGTSVEILARDFTAAMKDSTVKAILLNVDSPGGEANGIHELGEMIFAARGVKPIVAYSGGACCSAALWLASAADEIVVDRTASVGSIGVVMAYPKPDGEKATSIEIVSSQSPHKRPDVSTKTGLALIQSRVDALADVFVEVVARNRGVTAKKVESDFGRGGVLVGAAAVKAGLADSLGSLESVIARLAATTRKSSVEGARPLKPTASLDPERAQIVASLEASGKLTPMQRRVAEDCRIEDLRALARDVQAPASPAAIAGEDLRYAPDGRVWSELSMAERTALHATDRPRHAAMCAARDLPPRGAKYSSMSVDQRARLQRLDPALFAKLRAEAGLPPIGTTPAPLATPPAVTGIRLAKVSPPAPADAGAGAGETPEDRVRRNGGVPFPRTRVTLPDPDPNRSNS